MAEPTDYVAQIRGIAEEARQFSFEMYRYNTEQAKQGQAVDGATKVTNNWMNKPEKVQTTQ